MNDLEDLGPLAKLDVLRMMIGPKIGSGIGRTVFRLKTDPEKVIKIEDGTSSFQNILEWEIWDCLQHSNAGRWLAPCHWISPCGIALIQSTTFPLLPSQLPKKVPAWLTDVKPENWGQLGKRAVCHDYGYTNLLSRGADARMRKAEW